MEEEKIDYKKVTITLPATLLKEYKNFVVDNGYNMSGRIAILIKGDLKNKENQI